MKYKWYDDVPANSTVEQGDIVERCNIIIPNERHYSAILNNEENNEPLDVKEINGIVLSQSCDIQNEKIDSIILCPIWSLQKFVEKGDGFRSSKMRENLRKGIFPEYHLLQKFKGNELPEDFYYVDFHRIYSVPKAFIEALLKNKTRKRLLPPYREHLSQSFARYFMRVGLPVDIPNDEIKNYGA
ncbi:MAG: hypothetical protein LBC59_05725 [Chitinispirillales bacterium]|jgi:hypothetical protein|nr:hypothetical protein [Chitinispirillales bacterium]